MQVSGKFATSRTAVFALATCVAIMIPTPAFGDHVFDTDTPFANRGACESASAKLDNFDRTWLGDANPDLQLSDGEVRSMLQRAWRCEIASDGQWYITDHRVEVLGSDWWLRRLP